MPGDAIWATLLVMRRELASRLDIVPGPDLGSPMAEDTLDYLPAYKRYDGLFYQNAILTHEDIARREVRIVIVSALYGLLLAYEPIRDYDLALGSEFKSGGKVMQFWKSMNLAHLLHEIIDQWRPAGIHNLLSKDYSDLLRLKRDGNLEFAGAEVITPEVPPGFDALRARGRYLRHLLDEERE
jgi:cytoplasmic iron level regulating protein YaaA (DUF328/UPF0246 family)